MIQIYNHYPLLKRFDILQKKKKIIIFPEVSGNF